MENTKKIGEWMKARTGGIRMKHLLALAALGFIGSFGYRTMMALDYERIWAIKALVGL